jgi:hypothetical protein
MTMGRFFNSSDAWKGLPKLEQTVTVIICLVWYGTQIFRHNWTLETLAVLVRFARVISVAH